MVLATYITCGFCYTIYTFIKVIENKQSFLMMFNEEFSSQDLKNFFIVLTFLSFIAWPIMMLNEINNKKDL